MYRYELPYPGQWQVPGYKEQRRRDRRPLRRVIRERQMVYHRKYADPNIRPSIQFQAGDLVLARQFRKEGGFRPPWTGPHNIIQKITPEVYEIDRDGNYQEIHIDDLRPAPHGNEDVEIDTDSDNGSDDRNDFDETTSSEEEDIPEEEEDIPDEGIPGERDVRPKVDEPHSAVAEAISENFHRKS